MKLAIMLWLAQSLSLSQYCGFEILETIPIFWDFLKKITP
jgi:hypothetical protein